MLPQPTWIIQSAYETYTYDKTPIPYKRILYSIHHCISNCVELYIELYLAVWVLKAKVTALFCA